MLELAGIFTDGAVLQRDMEIPVFGAAEPRSAVVVKFRDVEVNAPTADSGEFRAYLPPMSAGGPDALSVRCVKTGETVVLNDVFVGEVWLASGQSNMRISLAECAGQRELFAGEARSGLVRAFTVGLNASGARQRNAEGAWRCVDADNCGDVSAVAAWTAEMLARELHVAVGVIVCAWGGATIEAWTSFNTLRRNPDMTGLLVAYHRELGRFEPHSYYLPMADAPLIAPVLEKVAVPDPGMDQTARDYAGAEFDDSAWTKFELPGSWIAQGVCHNGSAWFRRRVVLPPEWRGKALELHLGGVDKHDITFFNGVCVGRTGEGFDDSFWNQKRRYPVPAELTDRAEAVIAIRGFSGFYDGAFSGEAGDYYLAPACEDAGGPARLELAGTWRATAERDFGRVPLYGQIHPFPRYNNCPGILFDGMLAPLVSYAMRGVLWYQGYQNAAGDPFGSRRKGYERKLKDLADDWRFHWGEGDFPFYVVQQHDVHAAMDYQDDSPFARLRDDQRRAVEGLDNAFLVPALGLGEAGNIHPADKRSLGYRLAESVLSHTYGFAGRRLAPMPESAVNEGHVLRVRFGRAGGKLRWRGEEKGFFIAGDDGRFFPAEAKLEENGFEVLLSSPEVAIPVTVRYAWADDPPSPLFGESGIPAPGFELRAE